MDINKPIIRFIALLLVVTILWQDVVWANSDMFYVQNQALAQKTLATDEDKANSFLRFACPYLDESIKERLSTETHADSLTLYHIDKVLSGIRNIAVMQGLKSHEVPKVETEIDHGYVRIVFSDGTEMLFYNVDVFLGADRFNDKKINRYIFKRVTTKRS